MFKHTCMTGLLVMLSEQYDQSLEYPFKHVTLTLIHIT